MDTESIYIQMEQDFESLVNEHIAAANNEYFWALGSSTAEDTKMHEENMEHHKLMAKMYLKMKEDILAFIETYDYEEE